MTCMEIREMPDLTRNEKIALDHAAVMGGEVIEGFMAQGAGSDFAQWSAEMYDALVESIVLGFTDKLRELGRSAAEDAPF